MYTVPNSTLHHGAWTESSSIRLGYYNPSAPELGREGYFGSVLGKVYESMFTSTHSQQQNIRSAKYSTKHLKLMLSGRGTQLKRGKLTVSLP